MNGAMGMAAAMGGGVNASGAPSNPPPSNYVCHKCNVMGHWIQECPLNVQQQTDYSKPPPPNYICHRCGVPGHWIKNCPTNGNTTFDNKPHLKVIKTHEGQSVTVNERGQQVNVHPAQSQQMQHHQGGVAGQAVQGVSLSGDTGMESLSRIPKTTVGLSHQAQSQVHHQAGAGATRTSSAMSEGGAPMTSLSHSQGLGLSESMSMGGGGGGGGAGASTTIDISQPPSKKRRLNQL